LSPRGEPAPHSKGIDVEKKNKKEKKELKLNVEKADAERKGVGEGVGLRRRAYQEQQYCGQKARQKSGLKFKGNGRKSARGRGNRTQSRKNSLKRVEDEQ